MLRQFLTEHREELITRTRERASRRLAPRVSQEDLESGVPVFLDQLMEALRLEQEQSMGRPTRIGESAAKHGAELLRMDFTVAQVVHSYADIGQSIIELATELKAPISSDEFHTLNACLDDAIAGAVTEYTRQRERSNSDQEILRLGFLAHELRNLISSALLSYQMLRTGSVAISGNTGGILGRSLMAIRALTDHTLAKVRLEEGIETKKPVRLVDFIEDVEASASMEAQFRGVHLNVGSVDQSVLVNVDRQILASAASNLLQNAFKFTPRQGHVWLRTRKDEGRVLIDVEDQCGGLPPGMDRELFKPFKRRASDKSGLGLGLVISRQGVRANGGDIQVSNLPGKGCIFTIELPIIRDA